MIFDRMENAARYNGLHSAWREGIKFAKSLFGAEPGRYTFENGFALVQVGETQPLEGRTYEAHRKYLDVQIMVEGTEEMYVQDLSRLTEAVPYDAQKDALFLQGPGALVTIRTGDFYVMFPNDGHMPVLHTGKTPTTYRKIVLKLPVED